MIHPNMATMLCILATDAAVTPSALDAALRYAADRSFNAISIDGDSSTNDSVYVLANGQAGPPPPPPPEAPQRLRDGVLMHTAPALTSALGATPQATSRSRRTRRTTPPSGTRWCTPPLTSRSGWSATARAPPSLSPCASRCAAGRLVLGGAGPVSSPRRSDTAAATRPRRLRHAGRGVVRRGQAGRRSGVPVQPGQDRLLWPGRQLGPHHLRGRLQRRRH